jgi:hypothetical protein
MPLAMESAKAWFAQATAIYSWAFSFVATTRQST